MREIKFRAWSSGRKEMAEVESIHFKGNAVYLISKYLRLVANLDKIELMQFTGITDEQNIEIYEDDIVKFSVKDFNEVVGYLERDIVGTVKFDAGSFYIEYLDDHKKTMSLPFNSDILMSIHVIGDAYRGI